ncbi:MAG: metallophosphoesterase family protein [Candidatus Geothermincolia bacterium]
MRKAPRRWKRHTVIVLLAIVTLAVTGLTALKIHETWILPRDYKMLNTRALAQIEKDWEKFDSEFIDKDGRTHGYSMAVISDNHSSRKTFGKVIDKINKDNADIRKDWLKKKMELARLQSDKSIPEAEKVKKTAQMENLIDEIHKMQTLFVIDCGDLAYDGDVTKYRLSLQMFRKLNVPMVTAIGNHDIRGDGRTAYREVFGPFNYSFVVGNAYFIVLDDANEKQIEPAQMKWLEKQLEESKPYDYCFMVMHVPPFKGEQNPNVPMKRFLGSEANAQEIRDLATKYRVTFVLAGHIHTYDFAGWDVEVAPPEGLADMRVKDQSTDFVITGGAGARLWKVDKGVYEVLSRAAYHFFDVIFNAELTSVDPKTGKQVTEMATGFRRDTVKVSHPDAWYTFEEIWQTTYAKITELYPREMLVLVPVLALLLGYILLDMRRGRKRATENGDGAAGSA